MADRNTTQKDKNQNKVIEAGKPRCKTCFSRMSVIELEGTQKLWCFNCEASRLGR